MQLTIQDDEMFAYIGTRQFLVGKLVPISTVNYFLASGFRATTAQAIAFGTLADRDKTILLAQLIKLLSK